LSRNSSYHVTMEMHETHCYATVAITLPWKCNMVHRSCYQVKPNMSQYHYTLYNQVKNCETIVGAMTFVIVQHISSGSLEGDTVFLCSAECWNRWQGLGHSLTVNQEPSSTRHPLSWTSRTYTYASNGEKKSSTENIRYYPSIPALGTVTLVLGIV
jgi:hypothetical protein